MAGESTYYYGYCTWYVAHSLSWVRGGWGNAYQWASRAARDGFRLTQSPTVGSVVVYGPGHGYSAWGHVAIVTGVLPFGLFSVREMDAVAWNVVSTRVSNTHDVTAFILPPGGGAGAFVQSAINPNPTPVQTASAAWSRWTDARDRAARDAYNYLNYITGQIRGLI